MRSENMRSAIFFAAIASACVAFAQPSERQDAIQLTSQKHAWDLSWSDTEESLKGAITPDTPREGEPMKVSLTVGSFYGEPFKGPVTIALRPEGVPGSADTQTVMPQSGAWVATFVPKNTGPHVVDVSFRTTRLKVLHARINVDPAKLPRTLAWGIAIAAIALVVLGGGWFLLRKPTAPPPAPSEPPSA